MAIGGPFFNFLSEWQVSMEEYEQWTNSSDQETPSPNKPNRPKRSAFQRVGDVLRRVGEINGESSVGGAAHELPALPGLIVHGFGRLSLPLCEEQASKFDFGDDNASTLTADQVQITNPAWEQGIQLLTKKSATTLGYTDIELQPELSNVAIYAGGGQLNEQDEEDFDDRTVATLVVQLPSEYSGGDVVVEQSRYDLGKANGTAVLHPQYVVYAANAVLELEAVASGYQVLLQYSLLLPKEAMAQGVKRPIDLLRTQLVEAMIQIHGEESEQENGVAKIFALLLAKSFGTVEIMNAVAELDLERFQLLRDANGLLPLEKRFKFYTACLRYTSPAAATSRSQENVSWYSIHGQKLSDDISIEWTEKFRFVNPEDEALYEPWKNDQVHNDWEGLAIVGWPLAADVQNALTLMGEFGATASVLADEPTDATKLRQLFRYADEWQVVGLPGFTPAEVQTPVSETLCRKLCQAIMGFEDLSLVKIFVEKFLPRLETKDSSVVLLAELANRFGLDALSTSIKTTLENMPTDLSFKTALQLAEELQESPAAVDFLVTFALERAQEMVDVSPADFASCADLELLFKHAMACTNFQVFCDVASLFESMETPLLGPGLSSLSTVVTASSLPEHRAVATSLISRRTQWLLFKIAEIEKPFMWSLVNDHFPDASSISTFLQGPYGVLEVKGFLSINDARGRAALLRSKIIAPLKIKAVDQGETALVSIKKTGGHFSSSNMKTTEFKAELSRIIYKMTELNSSNSNTRKRLRDEQADELELM